MSPKSSCPRKRGILITWMRIPVPPLFNPIPSSYNLFPSRSRAQPRASKLPPRANNQTQPGRARYMTPAPAAKRTKPKILRVPLPGRKYNSPPPCPAPGFSSPVHIIQGKKDLLLQTKESTPPRVVLEGWKNIGLGRLQSSQPIIIFIDRIIAM